MKISAGQIERFLRAPDPRMATVLVHGPDDGVVRERVDRLVRAVVDDPGDPFRTTELTVEVVRGEPARLADEARSLCLMGGRRVVRLRQATDQATPACRTLLALDALEALVIIDAGELGPSSSLRRLIEGASNAAAIACYRDQGADLAHLIERSLVDRWLRAEPEAKTYLIEHLGADRGITQSELDKLALYMGEARPDAPVTVTLDDVAAVIGDSAALGLDDLVHAAALGHPVQVERCLERLLGQGQAPVRLIRALANHLFRLHGLAGLIELGTPPERVVAGARPPIHFRRKTSFQAALRIWTTATLSVALGRLLKAEIGCKTTGWPGPVLCREGVFAVCRQAKSAA